MKAMILAAGRGERMRPLTNVTPKPLLEVHAKPLIVWHIEKLAQAGFEEIIINIAHLGHKILSALGNGEQWGIKLTYSDEREEGALESAGGIIKALPLLGDAAFLLVNGDVWSDYAFDTGFDLGEDDAHLILVPNPPQHTKGDFTLKKGRVLDNTDDSKTYSGIAYYNPKMFKDLPYGRSALAPLLREAMHQNKISGTLHSGIWEDIGTPERLNKINMKAHK